jgi:hypothetical protein
MRGFMMDDLPGSLDGMQEVRGSDPLSSTLSETPGQTDRSGFEDRSSEPCCLLLGRSRAATR